MNGRLMPSESNILPKLGYDAHKMADFFKVLQKMSLSESEGGIPTFLSTHPDPGDRYNDVNKQCYGMADTA